MFADHYSFCQATAFLQAWRCRTARLSWLLVFTLHGSTHSRIWNDIVLHCEERVGLGLTTIIWKVRHCRPLIQYAPDGTSRYSSPHLLVSWEKHNVCGIPRSWLRVNPRCVPSRHAAPGTPLSVSDSATRQVCTLERVWLDLPIAKPGFLSTGNYLLNCTTLSPSLFSPSTPSTRQNISNSKRHHQYVASSFVAFSSCGPAWTGRGTCGEVRVAG